MEFDEKYCDLVVHKDKNETRKKTWQLGVADGDKSYNDVCTGTCAAHIEREPHVNANFGRLRRFVENGPLQHFCILTIKNSFSFVPESEKIQ